MHATEREAASMYARACMAWYGRRAQKVVKDEINRLKAAIRRWKHRRPQHVAAGRHLPIPTVDHSLCLGARSPIGLQLGCAGFDVEPSCPDAHLGSPVAACLLLSSAPTRWRSTAVAKRQSCERIG
jgi:hypothetical protein